MQEWPLYMKDGAVHASLLISWVHCVSSFIHFPFFFLFLVRTFLLPLRHTNKKKKERKERKPSDRRDQSRFASASHFAPAASPSNLETLLIENRKWTLCACVHTHTNRQAHKAAECQSKQKSSILPQRICERFCNPRAGGGGKAISLCLSLPFLFLFPYLILCASAKVCLQKWTVVVVVVVNGFWAPSPENAVCSLGSFWRLLLLLLLASLVPSDQTQKDS